MSDHVPGGHLLVPRGRPRNDATPRARADGMRIPRSLYETLTAFAA